MKKLELSAMDLAHYKQLDERQRRLFAAKKAAELGYYGVAMVCEAYGINRKTVYKGKAELLEERDDIPPSPYIRKSGGVKKKARSAVR